MGLVLPLLALFLLILIGRRRSLSSPLSGWEHDVLLAAAYWGAALVVLTEGLSLLDLLHPLPLLVAWLTLDIVLAGILLRARPVVGRDVVGGDRGPRLSAPEAAAVGLLVVMLLVLFAVAWVAPANNADSLLYHMPRVMHWIQNGNLAHYATGYGHQLWNPPWAEMTILNLRALWGNDQPAELVQWFSLVGLLVGVSGIVRLFGIGRAARWAAIAFAASLPMALLQATTTQNDLATAFWVIVVAFFVLRDLKEPATAWKLAGLGMAAGMALLTKGTAYIFIAPLIAWWILAQAWRTQPRTAATRLACLVVLVAGLNLGYWARNVGIGGTPLGPREWVAGHALGSVKAKIALYPVRIVRGVALHMATPWPEANDWIDSGVKRLYAVFGVDVNARLVAWSWNHEDRAGHPLHLLLIVMTLPWLGRNIRGRSGGVGGLALSALSALALLFLFVSPSLTPDGIRLQLPFFALWAPVFAAWVASLRSSVGARFGPLVLLASGVPFVLFSASRPVIGLRTEPGPWTMPCSVPLGCTSVGSVFAETVEDLLFANVPSARESVPVIADATIATGCPAVGLRLDSHDPEYLIWYFLGAPRPGIVLETIYTTPELSGLLDSNFRPCAIICTVCGGRTRLHGLELKLEAGGYTLFAGPTYTPDEDG